MEWQFTLILTALIVVLLYIGLSSVLNVLVFEDRIEIKLFRKYVVKKEDIVSTEVKKPNALLEFGGWGPRITIKKRGYLVPKQDALYMTLKDGTVVVICDDNPIKMEKVIHNTMKLDIN